MFFGYPVASCCGIPTQVTYYFDEVSCYVCVQLGIFSRSYYVLIMGLLSSICGVEVLMCVLQVLSVYCIIASGWEVLGSSSGWSNRCLDEVPLWL
jgi:hypothetical protein